MALSSRTGVVLALVATAMWSGNFIVARGLAQDIPSIQLAYLRQVVATLCMLPFVWPERKRILGAIAKHWRYLTLTTLISFMPLNAMYYEAAKTADATTIAIIATLTPVFIVIMAAIFEGDPITRRRLAGMIASFIGVLVLISRGNLSGLLHLDISYGDLWALAAAVIFAIYSYKAKKRPPDLSGMMNLFLLFVFTLIVFLPVTLVEAALTPPIQYDTPVILGILYIGVGCSFLAYVCWNPAIETIGPVKTGFIYYSLPFMVAVEATLILDEPVTLAHVAGGVLIIGGILLGIASVPKVIPPGEKPWDQHPPHHDHKPHH